MDRFDSMTAFAKVVECGSFAAAARRLRLSPAAVSTRVPDLEARLGVRLLNRTTRTVSLTEIGRIFHGQCTQLLAHLEEAERMASERQTTPRGLLRLNASPSFGMLHLAPAIAHFTARHPAVSVELVLSDQMVDLVEEGFDLAVRAEPVPDSSFIACRLAPCRTVVCGAPRYLDKRGTPKSPYDLSAHDCLILSTSPGPGEWAFTGAGGAEIRVRVAGSLRANSSGALRAAAIEGQGLILEHTCAVGGELKAGRLVPVLTNYAPPPAAICAIYPHNRHLPAKVRAFVDFLVARYGQDPDRDEWRHNIPRSAGETVAAGDEPGPGLPRLRTCHASGVLL